MMNDKNQLFRISLHWLFFVLLVSTLLSGCSIGKYLPDGKKLHGRTEINLQGSDYTDPNDLKYNLETISQPKPPSKGSIWAYFRFNNPEKKGGLKNLLKRKFGHEPIYFSQAEADRNGLVLKKYMSDQGYFNSTVTYDTSHNLHDIDVAYNVSSQGRYRLGKIVMPEDTGRIGHVINSISSGTYLKAGDFYDLSKLQKERNRIALEARNQGYYNFNAEKIFYFVDTTVANADYKYTADIWLKIKEAPTGRDYKRYLIGDTYIYPNYDLGRAEQISIRDTIRYNDLYILQNSEIIKPRTLDHALAQHKGEIYSGERHIASSNHFLDLGIYKFVNFNYIPRTRGDTNYLDSYVYLTPGKVQTVSGEVGLTTRPGVSGTIGVTLKANYSHKNVFGGAERLDLSLASGVQRGEKILIADDTISNNLSEITARAELSFPRFIVPFAKVRNTSTFHIPRTRISALANFQNRQELFSLSNYRLIFGYQWDETRRKKHQIDLISINAVQISDQSEPFNKVLEDNPLLRRSLANLFILGSTYKYTLTNQEISRLQDYYYFLGQIEFAGNTVWLGSKVLSGSSNEPFQLFNREFSQYTKLDVDYRYNWLWKNGNLITRISGGIGVPYLNSVSMPYIKQYFAGGANSMRGFPIRGLLGSSRTFDSDVAESSFEQTGELKFEWNLEYRFNLLRALYLKGALFSDIGNVWKLDPKNLETDRSKVFAGNRFLSEMAVASGFGIRLDIQYFVVRLDLAIPLRKPYLDSGNRWSFSKIGQDRWLRNNLVYNIALGYPF